MAPTTSNVAFGNAYSIVQANNIHGSVHVSTGTSWDGPRAVELSRRSGALGTRLRSPGARTRYSNSSILQSDFNQIVSFFILYVSHVDWKLSRKPMQD